MLCKVPSMPSMPSKMLILGQKQGFCRTASGFFAVRQQESAVLRGTGVDGTGRQVDGSAVLRNRRFWGVMRVFTIIGRHGRQISYDFYNEGKKGERGNFDLGLLA